jgi:hypothetical protein
VLASLSGVDYNRGGFNFSFFFQKKKLLPTPYVIVFSFLPGSPSPARQTKVHGRWGSHGGGGGDGNSGYRSALDGGAASCPRVGCCQGVTYCRDNCLDCELWICGLFDLWVNLWTDF